jgi:FAD synthase
MTARFGATEFWAQILKKLSFMVRSFNFKFGSKIRDSKRKIKLFAKNRKFIIFAAQLVNRLFCKIGYFLIRSSVESTRLNAG